MEPLAMIKSSSDSKQKWPFVAMRNLSTILWVWLRCAKSLETLLLENPENEKTNNTVILAEDARMALCWQLTPN